MVLYYTARLSYSLNSTTHDHFWINIHCQYLLKKVQHDQVNKALENIISFPPPTKSIKTLTKVKIDDKG